MAFLRKVKTASGATAVQVAVRVGNRDKVLKHLGSAHNEDELRVLLEKGRKELYPGQGELPLFEKGTPGAEKGRTLAKYSRLLWETLQDAYRVLGFDQAVRDSVFEQLVLARIVEPTSKADAVRILKELGVDAPHENTLYNCLQRCAGRDYRSRLAAACFQHATGAGDLSLVLYDVTTLYFETEKEDTDTGPNQGLRKVGYSKERRVEAVAWMGWFWVGVLVGFWLFFGK